MNRLAHFGVIRRNVGVDMDIICISDDELKRLAEELGPESAQATILRRLREKRSRDRQVHAWQVGSYYFIGPAPDAETEMAMLELAAGSEDEEE